MTQRFIPPDFEKTVQDAIDNSPDSNIKSLWYSDIPFKKLAIVIPGYGTDTGKSTGKIFDAGDFYLEIVVDLPGPPLTLYYTFSDMDFGVHGNNFFTEITKAVSQHGFRPGSSIITREGYETLEAICGRQTPFSIKHHSRGYKKLVLEDPVLYGLRTDSQAANRLFYLEDDWCQKNPHYWHMNRVVPILTIPGLAMGVKIINASNSYDIIKTITEFIISGLDEESKKPRIDFVDYPISVPQKDIVFSWYVADGKPDNRYVDVTPKFIEWLMVLLFAKIYPDPSTMNDGARNVNCSQNTFDAWKNLQKSFETKLSSYVESFR